MDLRWMKAAQGVVVLAILLCGQLARGSYLCLFPREFHPGMPFHIALTIHQTTGKAPVTVQATLTSSDMKSGTEETLVQESTSIQTGESKLIKLQIPSSLNASFRHTLDIRGSGGLSFEQQLVLTLNMNQSIVMVQADKNIYKPGQTVLFRVLNLDKNLKPLLLPLSVIIKNAKGSKLERFDELQSSSGVVEKKYELPKYASLGTWKIEVMKGTETLHTTSFLVEEFVLPKFSVEVKSDPDFLIWNVYNHPPAIIVKSLYTYGKAVQGNCTLKVTRVGTSESSTLKKRIPESGIVEFSDINWGKIVGTIPRSSKTVIAHAVVEDVTGRQESSEVSIPVHRSNLKVEILPQSTTVIRHGIPAHLYFTVGDHFGNPVYKTEVRVIIRAAQSIEIKSIVTLGEGQPYAKFTYTLEALPNSAYYASYDGTVQVQLDLDSDISDEKTIYLYHSGIEASISVKQTSSSTIKMGEHVEFTVTRKTMTTEDITMAYLVMGQGNILNSGTIPSSNKIQLTPTKEMCPSGILVVYMIHAKSTNNDSVEMVADYISLSPILCVNKKVTVSFPAKEMRTGTDANMHIRVDRLDGSNEMPGIHDIYYLAVDKSIVLLQGSTDLNERKVLDSLATFDLTVDTDKPPYSAGLILEHLGIERLGDVGTVIPLRLRADVMMVGRRRGKANDVEKEAEVQNTKLPEEKAPSPKIRKDFPDTWLWGKAQTMANGRVSEQVRLPDTITSWQVSAFAINSDGLAASASPFEITAFQTFFLFMNLPYSVKRGEVFTLKVTVFNYRDDEVDATVRLQLKDDFIIVGGQNKSGWSEKQVKILPNLASTVEFEINATTIGKIELHIVAEDEKDGQKDEVMRKLLVKPEGEVRKKAITDTIILVDQEPITKKFKIDWPYNTIIPDSQRLQVKVTGEIFGQSLSGLSSLVSYPVGCGEQNMVTTVPNIYGIAYIKGTDQKGMDDLVRKLVENMKKGFARQVDLYRHPDGSYSAWGPSEKSTGSTWLTAFVIKSFAQASASINVDETVLKSGVDFIKGKQGSDGQFQEDGIVYHTEMQKGTSSGLGMTVYALISMIETSQVVKYDLSNEINKALSYIMLEASKDSQMSSFTCAITAYALSLEHANKPTLVSTIDKLLKRIPEDEVPWSTKDPGDTTLTFVPQSKSYRLEMAAYILLTYTRLKRLTDAFEVMKWLQKQQNDNGGFKSTQDTVVILQALSEFGEMHSSTHSDGKVTVEAPNTGVKEDLDISGERSILLQIVDVPSSAEEVIVTLSGQASTMAIVKVVYYYNTPTEDSKSDGEKTVNIRTNSYRMSNMAHRISACVESSLPSDAGMYVASMVLPSGESAADSIHELMKRNPSASRIEIDEEAIIFYLDDVPKRGVCLHADIEREFDFSVQLPGSAKFYSYYEPEYVKEAPLVLEGAPFCPKGGCDNSAVGVTSLILSIFICTLLSLLVCM